MHVVLATRNAGKVLEIKGLLRDMAVEISSLMDHPEIAEIPEDGETFLENSRKKASVVASATGKWALADDSGLVVDALGGEPGVHSARYAGVQGDYDANNKKLLAELKNVPDGERQAAFVCTMVLASPEAREWVVGGRCEGVITRDPQGSGGFGFDPLFYVPEEGKTMAELSVERKNDISHRGKALRKMQKILVEILQNKVEK